jgi:two-component system NtrC family response regulator
MTAHRPNPAGSQQLIGHSEAIAELRTSIELAAASDVTVLLSGESGAGKTLAAQLIHRGSSRALAPLVLVSQSRRSSVGFATDLATLAPGGTIVIDHVETLTPQAQSALLRHLESSIQSVELRPYQPKPARLIVTTRKDLFSEVGAGRFRDDLYYRLNIIHVPVVPLRSRVADIVPTAEHFLRASRAAPGSRLLTPATADALVAHSWPGNVRELQRVLRRGLHAVRR